MIDNCLDKFSIKQYCLLKVMWSEEDNYQFYLEQKKSRKNTLEYHLRKIIKNKKRNCQILKVNMKVNVKQSINRGKKIDV